MKPFYLVLGARGFHRNFNRGGGLSEVFQGQEAYGEDSPCVVAKQQKEVVVAALWRDDNCRSGNMDWVQISSHSQLFSVSIHQLQNIVDP